MLGKRLDTSGFRFGSLEQQLRSSATKVSYRQQLLELYDLFPFERHPLWRAVIRKDLDYDQVINAEVQHYLRTREGRQLREIALRMAERSSQLIFELLLETYLEECTDDSTGPSHLDLIQRLVITGGVSKSELKAAQMTPGNAAAIALYRDITRRGAACHMLGAGAVEYFYSQLSPKIYEAYTSHYGMSDSQAETYRIHAPLDRTHAERAFKVLDEAILIHGWPNVRIAVRDAFIATSLHYDGMFQAATKEFTYWDGKER